MSHFRLTIFALVLCLVLPSQALAVPNIVAGTGLVMNKAQAAVDAGNFTIQAYGAIAKCDEADFDQALDGLKQIQQAANNSSKPNNPFAAAWTGGTAGAEADKATIRSLRAYLNNIWASVQPCNQPKKAEEAKTKTSMGQNTTVKQNAYVAAGEKQDLKDILAMLADKSHSQCKYCQRFDNEVDDAIDQAEAALASCDRGQFVEAMDWLDELAWDAPTADDEEDIDRTMDNLEREWRAAGNKKTCFGIAYPTLFEFITGAYVGAQHQHGNIGYLGTENGGGGNRILGIIEPDSTARTSGFDSELRVNLGDFWYNVMSNIANNLFGEAPKSRVDIFAGLRKTSTDYNGVVSMFEPGAQTLLLPGVGAGPNPSGFSVAAPNGFVDNLSYDADYTSTAYRLGLGKTLSYYNVELRPYVGFEYEKNKTHQMLSGSLADVGPLNFFYDTSIKNDVSTPFAGIDVSARPGTLFPNIPDDLKPQVKVHASLRYGLQFNDASGTDTLFLQGFMPGMAHISNDDITHSFRAGTGVTFNPDGRFSVDVGGGYEYSGNNANIKRDGVGLSKAEFDGASSWTLGLNARYRF